MLRRTRSLEALRELEILRNHRHPNIVEFVGYEEAVGMILIVTVFEPLGDLSAFLGMIHRSLCDDEATGIFRQLLKAVGFLHEGGVIHRDLKLENVLVASRACEGNLWRLTVKVTDFGLSKIVHDASASPTTSIHGFVGTKSYAAPEMFAVQDGNSFALQAIYKSPALDMWSLGILLYALLTRSFPGNVSEEISNGKKVPCPSLSFQGRIDDDIRRNVPLVQSRPSLQPLIFKLLRKDTNERIGQVAEAWAMLDEQFLDCSEAGSSSSSDIFHDSQTLNTHSPSAFASQTLNGLSPSVESIQTVSSASSTVTVVSSTSLADMAAETAQEWQLREDLLMAEALHQLDLQEGHDLAMAEELEQRRQKKLRRQERKQQEAADSVCAKELNKLQLLEQQEEIRQRAKQRYQTFEQNAAQI